MPERIAVTSSGVSALMIAMQALAAPGDEVVAVVPVWPNLTAQPAILGAKVKRVSLRPRDGVEFAHQIDQDTGAADGRPWRPTSHMRRRWAAVMGEAFERLPASLRR